MWPFGGLHKPSMAIRSSKAGQSVRSGGCSGARCGIPPERQNGCQNGASSRGGGSSHLVGPSPVEAKAMTPEDARKKAEHTRAAATVALLVIRPKPRTQLG